MQDDQTSSGLSHGQQHLEAIMKALFAVIASIVLLGAAPAYAGRDAGQLQEHWRSIEAVKKEREALARSSQATGVAGRAGPEGREGATGEPAQPKFRGSHPKDAYPRY